MNIARFRNRRTLLAIVALVSLAVRVAPVYGSESSYLQSGPVDSIGILPPPPAPGSAEQAVDLATVVAAHRSCTVEEMAAAKSEDRFSLFIFAPAIGTFFRAGALPKTEAFFHRVQKTADPVQEAAKVFYKRTRPYVVEPSLVVEHPESSFSYPSAHATFGTIEAVILADLFPEKREEILAVGRNVGWHRVELGKHYPTDVYAGRVVGLAIVNALKSNAEFRKDFDAVKAELAAAAAQSVHASP